MTVPSGSWLKDSTVTCCPTTGPAGWKAKLATGDTLSGSGPTVTLRDTELVALSSSVTLSRIVLVPGELYVKPPALSVSFASPSSKS